MEATPIRYQPAHADYLPEAIDHLLHECTAGPMSVEQVVDGVGNMQSNLLESWDTYFLQISLPGVDPSALEIRVVGRQVMVGGEYRIPTMETASSVWSTISSGQFLEVFRIPGEVNGDAAQASYDRGILTVTLPKVAHLKPRTIPFQAIP